MRSEIGKREAGSGTGSSGPMTMNIEQGRDQIKSGLEFGSSYSATLNTRSRTTVRQYDSFVVGSRLESTYQERAGHRIREGGRAWSKQTKTSCCVPSISHFPLSSKGVGAVVPVWMY